MDKEKLFGHLDRRYSSKRDMITRIPLGTQPEVLWRELLERRRARSVILPLYSCRGTPYWYVTTDKMIAASEKIVEDLYETDIEFDPYMCPTSVSTLEEVFYTGFVEGVQLTMQAAMEFLTSGLPPRDIEEQLITNNRQAGNYAAVNLFRTIDKTFLSELAFILTDGMDNGGRDFRNTNYVDFVSPDGEEYEFPAAITVPDRINDLCVFLAASDVHPLIKAAVAQAYILVIRPFPEGNERLGRILSIMILLRAGYTFFADVSLSSLIAKRSYAYFEAAANILRAENGGDLTYFVEYFLELLSRAVDERKLRMRQNEERIRQTERELARTPLAPLGEPQTDEEGGDNGNSFFTAEQYDASSASGDKMSPGDLYENLRTYANNGGYTAKTIVDILIDMLNRGEPSFTIKDIKECCDLTAKQVENAVYRLRDKDLIRLDDKWTGHKKRYVFNASIEPSSNVITTQKSETSISTNCAADETEIRLARVRDKLYEYAMGDGDIMKKCAIQLLEFMDSGIYSFTVKDIESRTGIDASGIGKRLFRLRQKDIIERIDEKKSGSAAIYRFSLKLPALEPRDYEPEVIELVNRMRNIDVLSRAKRVSKLMRSCLSKGLITAEDYEKTDHAEKLETDMKLPEQMGIVQKLSDGVYRLCRKRMDITPVFTEKQKNTMDILCKAFCRKQFSSKEAMLPLNLSKSCTNIMLLQLTAIGALDCSKGRLGNLYRLKENYINQPSLFEKNKLQRDELEDAVQTNDKKAAFTADEAVPPVYSDEVYALLDRLDASVNVVGDRRIGSSIRNCLAKGMISLSDYLEYGYSKSNWHKDMALAKKLGLISPTNKGCYIINRELSSASSELTETQKKGITALYEAFGEENFSSEMYIATLNYSGGYSWTMLHTLTLLRVLDYKTTDEGNRYKLLINPKENPEYFYMAA